MLKKLILKSLKSKLLLKLMLIQKEQFNSNVYFVSVNPQKISHISIIPEDARFISGGNAYFGSYSGFFDYLKIPFSKHFMYRTVEQMIEGKDWQTTPYFKKLLKLKSGKEALKHLHKIENLIQNISEKGYLSQYQLGRFDAVDKIGKWEKPRHEMLIAMDREGRLFRIKGGRHRLAIAQNLKIKEMPAILTLYHKNAEGELPTNKRILTGDKEDFRPF